MMSHMNRRKFLQRSLAATAGSYVSLSSAPRILAQGGSPNDEIRIAIAGVRSQGNGHIGRFQKLDGVQIVALCDPDQKILDERVEQVRNHKTTKKASDVRGYRDVRRVLEREDIDAIVIATPNHWHSLMTVWACQAGKDVYVEKPVSHSVWEGGQMVKAARKYKRVVQAGTQQRSCPAVQEVARDIKAGRFGKVKWVHCSKLRSRASIGKVNEPLEVPAYIDYNLWAGPAPMTPVMRKQFHYDWHWQWNWGDGEMGNWGIHYIDDLRHFLGWNSVPTKVIAAGNRWVWNDDGQTPNMHFALFEYDGLPVVVDIRNLPDPERDGDVDGAIYLKSRGGNHIECEDGYIRLARGGGSAYDRDGNRVQVYKGDAGAGHCQNFIDAMRSRHIEDLNAEIEVCHLSTVMCHQANIGFRVGSDVSLEEARAAMKSHGDALNTLNDITEQLEGNKVDLKKNPWIMGPQLTYNPKQERFVGDHAEAGNKYIKKEYRGSFVVPDQV